jgi:hypothetical protein
VREQGTLGPQSLSSAPPVHSSACRGRRYGDKLVTEDDVRREIFQAIIQCRGRNGPLINQRDTCEVLAAGVFDTLKANGLLKLDADD